MKTLADYLTATGRKKIDFAKAIGVSRGYVTLLCNGTRRPGLAVAVSIEAETGGKVPAKAWDAVPSENVTFNPPDADDPGAVCQPAQTVNTRGDA